MEIGMFPSPPKPMGLAMPGKPRKLPGNTFLHERKDGLEHARPDRASKASATKI
jgi:hypothetical protein